jgi:hypothetical protein
LAAVVLATDFLPKKLRVGLFADSALQPRWVVEAFARVARCEFAEIALIRTGDAPPAAVPWLYRTGLDTPLELARYVPHQNLHDLDVAFALGALDDTAIDGIANFGVWRFYGDGVREVVDGAPLTSSGIKVRLAPGAEARLAYQSWSRTDPLSVKRNRARLLAKSADFALRALRDAERFGHGWLGQCKSIPEQGRTAISPYAALATLTRNRGLSLISSVLNVEERFAAFRPGNGAPPTGLEGFTRLPGRNPFPMRGQIFFEQDGRIAVSDLSTTTFLMEGAYPFLVEEGAELFMAASGKLYRCLEFPRRWQLEGELPCGNATLHRATDRWWLFGTGAFEEELELYYAPKLGGPWQPHPRNPVKSDARNARPAGRLYWRNGALYRPAQMQGLAVSINRVVRLTPHDYAERQVQIIPGLRGFNQSSDLTVVDAVTRRRRFT